MATFSAINISRGNGTLVTKIPLVYKWKGDVPLDDTLKTEEKLREYVDAYELLTRVEDYVNGTISFFSYDIDSNEYKEYSYTFQEFYPDISTNRLLYIIMIEEMSRLYELSFGKACNLNVNEDGTIPDPDKYIRDAYIEISNKYKGKLTSLTVLNAIRSHIQTDSILGKLTPYNIETIITKLSNIIALNNGE